MALSGARSPGTLAAFTSQAGDLRVDGGGKYSARLTSDGFAALALPH